MTRRTFAGEFLVEPVDGHSLFRARVEGSNIALSYEIEGYGETKPDALRSLADELEEYGG